MGGKAFDVVVYNTRERPVSVDWNRQQAQALRTVLDTLASALLSRTAASADPSNAGPLSAFMGDSFRVKATNPASIAVEVTAGMGLIMDAADVASNVAPPLGPGATGIDVLSRAHAVMLNAAATFAIPNPNPGLDRYDIIEVASARHFADSNNKDVFDPGTSTFAPQAVYKTYSQAELDTQTGTQTNPALASTAGLSYKCGTAGAGVPPATTAGYIRLAVVKVDAVTVPIPNTNISDWRPPMGNLGDGIIRVRARAGITARGGATPTTMSVHGPAGVRVACTWGFESISGSFWFFGIGPTATLDSVAVASLIANMDYVAAFPPPYSRATSCWAEAVTVGELTAGDLTTLATNTYPSVASLGLAEGQPYLRVVVVAGDTYVAGGSLILSASSNAGADSMLGDPHAIVVDLTLSRA